MPGRTPPRIRSLPSWMLGEAARRGDRLVASALAARGLRKHHYAVMTTLQDGGGASQADLGRALGIDRSDLHAVVGDLDARGFVTRRPSDLDPRRHAIELTGAGTAVVAELDASVADAQVRLLEPLSPAERQQLAALLGTLCSPSGPRDADR